MARWRHITVGDLLDGVARYRPFALVLVGILLLALVLPGARSPDSDTAGPSEFASGPSEATRVPGDQGSVDVTRPVVDAGALGQDSASAAAGPARGAARETGTRAQEATAPALRAAEGADPLAAPDCDPATGRLKVPFSPGLTAAVVYAPNCVPMWPKGADNGGATYKGVTGDTITIAIPRTPQSEQDQQAAAMVQAAGYEAPEEEEYQENRAKVLEAFQAHYETYGRKVEVVEFFRSGDDDASQRADAIKVANEIKAFASLGGSGNSAVYPGELAARGVLCIVCVATQPHWNFQEWAPYAWNDRITGTGMLSHVSELLGKRVGAGEAAFAGDPLLQQQSRRFGLISYNTPDGAYDGLPEFFDEELGKYGMSISETIEYLLDVGQTQEQARVMMARFKDKGITSILCWCDPLSPVFFTQEATRQQFFPEWIITGSYLVDTAFFARTYDQLQWRNAFGASLLTARLDPKVWQEEGNIASWHHGSQLDSYPHMTEFGMLFTGIHLAGPKLTPETFRDGMFSQKPASGFITRLAVSYGPGVWPWASYNAMNDTTDVWWDPEADGPDELDAPGKGLYRYPDMGKRYVLGGRPAVKAPFFETPNTVTIYGERPPQDTLPTYERRDPLREP